MSNFIEQLTEHSASYGPTHCQPMTPDPISGYSHGVGQLHQDGNDDEINFKWHWPRGTFSARMSAKEIATFVMPHMPYIVPLLSAYPRVQAEFAAMLVRMVTLPENELDRLMSWIKPVIHTEDDDLIVLNIRCREPQPVGPTYFS